MKKVYLGFLHTPCLKIEFLQNDKISLQAVHGLGAASCNTVTRCLVVAADCQ